MGIYKIVLTGGPCAGKTKIFQYVKERLKREGYYVIGIPETARECIANGLIPNNDKEHILMFQDIILNYQKTKEQIAERYANSIMNNNLEILKNKKGIVVLYDRAIMDNRAYLNLEDYERLLKSYNYNELELIDKYDLVIDLISVATLKKELYVVDEERHETSEEAEKEDMLTSNAWLLHRNLRIVKPTDNITEKADLILTYIYDLIFDKQKKEIVMLPIDEDKTDLSLYNDNNSKRIKITNFYLNTNQEFNYVISKKQYKGLVSFVSKKELVTNNAIFFKENRQIGIEETLEEINLYGINKIIEKNILSIIDNGNFYNIIETSNGLALEVDVNDISQIPENIVLKNEVRKLVKIK